MVILILVFLTTYMAPITHVVASQPNILLIVGDDFGHADMGYHDSNVSIVETPNMDAFAAAGVKLESFYTQPICAAARSSILTGRYVSRLGFQHSNPPKAGGGVGALPLDEITLPQALKHLGYMTHHVGKWHLGLIKKAYQPQNRGFDSSFGYYEGTIDYYKHTVGPNLDLHAANASGTQQCQPQFNGTYDLDMWVEHTNTIIDSHDTQSPLFLYLALHSVHTPDTCPKKWYDKYPTVPDTDNRRTMCGMVSAMDDGIGKVVINWQKKGEAFWKNSLIIFFSDNGGPTYAGAGTANYPLRGGKLTLYEGGVRVNAWALSPLIEKPGRIERGLMHITDIFPTFVGGLPGQLKYIHRTSKPLDGNNQWDMLSTGAVSSRDEILHLFDPLGNADVKNGSAIWSGCEDTTPKVEGKCQISAGIRKGPWKLLVGMWASCAKMEIVGDYFDRYCGWHIPPLPKEKVQSEITDVNSPTRSLFFDKKKTMEYKDMKTSLPNCTLQGTEPVALFNIEQDPYEQNEQAAQNPTVVQELLARLSAYQCGQESDEWKDPQWPPYTSCDTESGSCHQQRLKYEAAALKKGCVAPFL